MLKEIRILIVDDDEMSLEMLSSSLAHQKNIVCTTATNGRKAMDILESSPGIDIVLLDLQMPVMTGYEVIMECKGNPYLSEIPIIVIAADHHEKLKALTLGADDFMSKPYSREELELRINKLILSHRKSQGAHKAKNEFLALASHELRTPLHQINGFTELLDDVDLNSKQRQFFELLKQATGNLTNIVKDILDYVQLDNQTAIDRMEPYSLRATIQSILEYEAAAFDRKGICCKLQIDENVSDALNGASYFLYKTIKIIIENAIKFSSGGTVEIQLREESLGKNSSRFCCNISDQGTGIPQEFHNIIFDPFVQIEPANTRKYGGFGLSLAIAKRMVELMGGTIEVSNNCSGGSTFTFSFYSELQNT